MGMTAVCFALKPTRMFRTHSAKSQNTAIFLFTALRSSHLTCVIVITFCKALAISSVLSSCYLCGHWASYEPYHWCAFVNMVTHREVNQKGWVLRTFMQSFLQMEPATTVIRMYPSTKAPHSLSATLYGLNTDDIAQ